MNELYNPITGETVEFSKAGYGGAGYADSLKGNPMIGHTRQIGSLLPTGKHVSHANALLHIKGKHVGTMPRGRSQALVRVKGKHTGGVMKSDEGLGDLSRQPGMINPGVQTSSWSHGTPNQNFAAQSGRRGRKIS